MMTVDRLPVPVATVDGLTLVGLQQGGVADHVGEDHRDKPSIKVLPHTFSSAHGAGWTGAHEDHSARDIRRHANLGPRQVADYCRPTPLPPLKGRAAPRNGCVMRALSADAALQHGLNQGANIIDEIHTHRDGPSRRSARTRWSTSTRSRWS
jgi:hypothetical protein